MAEVLVKTLTRHRDPQSKFYMCDWTAFDVLPAMPDGYYSKNKHGGAKGMGIVLKIDGDIPKDYAGGIIDNPEWSAINSGTTSPILQRSQKIIDLTRFLTDTELRDCFNHDLLVYPKHIAGSYVDIFSDRSERVALHPYDQSGSFASGAVDVGPNGHADANTFLEFESNIDATLTGALTGNTDEGGWTDTTAFWITGTTTSAVNTITFSATSGGKSSDGKWAAGAHYFNVGDGSTGCVRCSEDYVNFYDLQFTGTASGANTNIRIFVDNGAGIVNIGRCIMTGAGSTSGEATGLYINSAGGVVNLLSSIIYGLATSGIYSGRGVNVKNAGVTVNVYNNTIVSVANSYYGVIGKIGGTCVVKNNAIFDNGDDVRFQTTLDYNAIDDADAQTHDVNVSSWTDVFTDPSSGDFTLKGDEATLDTAGLGPTGGDSNVPEYDILGNVRSGATCTVGAFEVVAAPGGGRTMSSLVAAGGLVGMGGIAGQGGGLAA